MVGLGGVDGGVVVLRRGSDGRVVFGRAVHRRKVLTVVLGNGDRPLLPQNVRESPGNTNIYIFILTPETVPVPTLEVNVCSN